ncbi:MAG: hypothetical protein J6Y37_13610 [Paludibacteraceae bacterium]|nr:hypothetical protein [Paludibacteraceae bacterium]
MRFFTSDCDVDIYTEGTDSLLVVFYHRVFRNVLKAKRYSIDGKSLLADLHDISRDNIRMLSKAEYKYNVRLVQEAEGLLSHIEKCPWGNGTDTCAWLTVMLP